MTVRPPWDEVPDTGMVPDGAYLIQVIEIGEGATKGGEEAKLPAGCIMYRAVHWVVEPSQFTGMQLYDNFVVGSAEDPLAEDPETWKTSIAARLFKQLFKKAGVPLGADLDEMRNMAVGQQLIAVVGSQVTARGTPMNQIRSYYAVGERQPGLDSGTPAARATAPKPRAAAPAPPAAAPPGPRAVPRAAPTPPAPAAPKAPTKAPTGVPQVLCTICKQQVPRNEFAAHVQAHTEGAEE